MKRKKKDRRIKIQDFLHAFFVSVQDEYMKQKKEIPKPVARVLELSSDPGDIFECIVLLDNLGRFNVLFERSQGQTHSMSMREFDLMRSITLGVQVVAEKKKPRDVEFPRHFTQSMRHIGVFQRSKFEDADELRGKYQAICATIFEEMSRSEKLWNLEGTVRTLDFFSPEHGKHLDAVLLGSVENSSPYDGALKHIGGTRLVELSHRYICPPPGGEEAGLVSFGDNGRSLLRDLRMCTQFLKQLNDEESRARIDTRSFWATGTESCGGQNFPVLSKIARSTLSLTDTHAPAEPSFSMWRRIDSEYRQNSREDLVCLLLLLF